MHNNVKVVKYANFMEFVEANRLEEMDNYFKYYHLLQWLRAVDNDKICIYDAYNIVDDDGCNVMAVFTTWNYFIYADNWSKAMIPLLLERIDFKRFTNYSFMGKRDLLLELFAQGEQRYTLKKDRLVYTCDAATPIQNDVRGQMRNATMQDLQELTAMNIDFYKEEYDGQGKTSNEQLQEGLVSGIMKNALFVLEIDNHISSMVQVVNDFEKRHPYIGNFYTKPAFRNHGFGYKLLHALTEGALKDGNECCGLIANVSNPAANHVFVKTGYKPVYDWVYLFKAK